MYFHSQKKEECCGCEACENVCPKAVIRMVADEEGFLYPVKNNKCINCGLCEKICPFSQNMEKKSDKINDFHDSFPITFAAYGETERIGSSSGGIFFVLGKKIIERNGTVYGAVFDKNFQLHHFGAKTLEELNALRGSKYLQSNIGLIMQEIKQKLMNNEYVFFVGTPCQVAGLKSFLKQEYTTLLTADLICHGVPSQKMFDEHRKYLEEKYDGKLVNYQFRDNASWGVCEICDFTNPTKNKNRNIKLPTYELSPYLYSFMYAYDYRLSCYECPFAKIPRQGDITLGDYWGIKRIFPKMDSSKGVSAVLVNNKKGLHFWNEIKDNLVYFESTYQDVSIVNGNLLHASVKPDIRNFVYKMIRERGYLDVAEKEFRSPKYNVIKIKVTIKKLPVLKQLIKLYKKINKR